VRCEPSPLHRPPGKEQTVNLTSENKAYIDKLSYQELLSSWRFAPIGDKWFQGETGIYWEKRMSELRQQSADHVGASKAIGWERSRP